MANCDLADCVMRREFAENDIKALRLALERIRTHCNEVKSAYDGDSDYDMFLRWSDAAIKATD